MKDKLKIERGFIMKFMDMIISAAIKKGVLYEARNCDLEFDVPAAMLNIGGEDNKSSIKIKMKVEHKSLKLENE